MKSTGLSFMAQKTSRKSEGGGRSGGGSRDHQDIISIHVGSGLRYYVKATFSDNSKSCK